MSIANEITRIIGAKNSLKLGLNDILPPEHQITTEAIDEYPDFLEHIETGSGGGGSTEIEVTIDGSSAIICAELPNVIFELRNSSGTLLDTETTGIGGGVVTFSVNANGTYTITALDSEETELWENQVVINNVGTYNCKSGKALNLYTWTEINTASTGGYAKFMWSVGDSKTYSKSGDLLHGYEFIIIGFEHDTLASDGTSKAGITFMSKKYYTGSSYNINLKLFLNGSSSYRNNGGYRASLMRQRFQANGATCFSQASGVTAGLLASGFTYADGSSCPLYSYTESTNTFADATAETFSTSKVYFVAGYYKQLGTILEENFIVGKHFTYSTNGYEVPSTWVTGTTYYVIYPTLQEDGVLYTGLSDIVSVIKPILKKQSTGNQQTSLCETEEKIFPLAVEEVFGFNKDSILDQGTNATNASAFNASGEGTIYEYFTSNYQHGKIALGGSWWTRSPSTSSGSGWNSVSYSGYVYTSSVNGTGSVRPCFCI